MNSGELHAWHYAMGQPVRVGWREGRITFIEKVEVKPARDMWIAPPLVDLQINGYAGVDFQQEGVSVNDLLRTVRALRRDGCAYFFLTLVTDEWQRLLKRLTHFRSLRESSEELRAAIRGWHIEGPFLSNRPGFCGAHNPAFMLDPILVDQLRIALIPDEEALGLLNRVEHERGLPRLVEETVLNELVFVRKENSEKQDN